MLASNPSFGNGSSGNFPRLMRPKVEIELPTHFLSREFFPASEFPEGKNSPIGYDLLKDSN